MGSFIGVVPYNLINDIPNEKIKKDNAELYKGWYISTIIEPNNNDNKYTHKIIEYIANVKFNSGKYRLIAKGIRELKRKILEKNNEIFN